uniref:Glycosyltransferase n=1 Tax=Rubia yunnanensis TaxID=1650721 RepID=A0A896APG7_9GENT|nr:glycosyltransferase [Rubia yunnanensis]
MESKTDQIHVVLVPWSAFGHIIPMFELAIAIAKAGGVHASLVSTPGNILRLPELPPDLRRLIDLVALPLPSDPDNPLPGGAEATVDIPFDKIPLLKLAHNRLKKPFMELLADRSPDWIISDSMVHWAAEAAAEMGVPVICFYPFSAATAVFFGPPKFLTVGFRPSPESMMEKPPWVDFKSTVAYRKHEAPGVHAGFFGRDVSGPSTAERVARAVSKSKAVAIRSCREFESGFFDLQEKISEKPAIPVGFLPPGRGINSTNLDDEWKNIFRWLDDQGPKSVFYVGFGSECKLERDQIDAIARGLELSGVRFIWVLQNADDEGLQLDSVINPKIRGNGVVKVGWAPQRAILGHPSIGGCLFHGGWGSVIETLQYGHCLVILPFIIDQGLNARLLVEKGLAIEVDRGEDGSFTEEDIADSLRKAMVVLRERAEQGATMFRDQELNDKYIEEFVHFMKINGVKKLC